MHYTLFFESLCNSILTILTIDIIFRIIGDYAKEKEGENIEVFTSIFLCYN